MSGSAKSKKPLEIESVNLGFQIAPMIDELAAEYAGSAKIGRYCLIGGGAGIVGHIEICDKVLVTAMTLVTHSLHEPGEYSSGTPIQPSRDWRRNAARFKHLDALARKIGGLPQAKD